MVQGLLAALDEANHELGSWVVRAGRGEARATGCCLHEGEPLWRKKVTAAEGREGTGAEPGRDLPSHQFQAGSV